VSDHSPGINDLSVVVDCRWLGFSGVGRTTELLLAGLHELAPDGEWKLWGPSAAERFLWPNARIVEYQGSPMRWAAQRDAFSIPSGDVVLWMHAVRPLVSKRSVMPVHDLIPLHWAGSTYKRLAWKKFFGRSCKTATRIAVYSEATRRRLSEEFGVHDSAKVRLPLDRARAERVRSLRAGQSERKPMMLYVGQVKPHKNLRRAVEGYYLSEFCSRGGTFSILAGGATAKDELADIENVRLAHPEGSVDILPRCTDDELDQLYASASFLIQPSLEEGFGLPVAEALASGVPVCCSDVDSLREAAQGQATLFDPMSPESIARAIDETAAKAASGVIPEPLEMPDEVTFAREFLELIRGTLGTDQAASASE